MYDVASRRARAVRAKCSLAGLTRALETQRAVYYPFKVFPCQASNTAFRSHCARPAGRCERGVLPNFERPVRISSRAHMRVLLV